MNESLALIETNMQMQECFIALCRLIRKCNLTADTGPVWKCKKFDGIIIAQGKQGLFEEFHIDMGKPGGFFLLGIGDLDLIEVSAIYPIPMDRWEDCYFAKEIKEVSITLVNCYTPDRFREFLSNLLP